MSERATSSSVLIGDELYRVNQARIEKARAYIETWNAVNEEGKKRHDLLQQDLERKVREGEEARRMLQVIAESSNKRGPLAITGPLPQQIHSTIPAPDTTSRIEEVPVSGPTNVQAPPQWSQYSQSAPQQGHTYPNQPLHQSKPSGTRYAKPDQLPQFYQAVMANQPQRSGNTMSWDAQQFAPQQQTTYGQQSSQMQVPQMHPSVQMHRTSSPYFTYQQGSVSEQSATTQLQSPSVAQWRPQSVETQQYIQNQNQSTSRIYQPAHVTSRLPQGTTLTAKQQQLPEKSVNEQRPSDSRLLGVPNTVRGTSSSSTSIYNQAAPLNSSSLAGALGEVGTSKQPIASSKHLSISTPANSGSTLQAPPIGSNTSTGNIQPPSPNVMAPAIDVSNSKSSTQPTPGKSIPASSPMSRLKTLIVNWHRDAPPHSYFTLPGTTVKIYKDKESKIHLATQDGKGSYTLINITGLDLLPDVIARASVKSQPTATVYEDANGNTQFFKDPLTPEQAAKYRPYGSSKQVLGSGQRTSSTAPVDQNSAPTSREPLAQATSGAQNSTSSINPSNQPAPIQSPLVPATPHLEVAPRTPSQADKKHLARDILRALKPSALKRPLPTGVAVDVQEPPSKRHASEFEVLTWRVGQSTADSGELAEVAQNPVHATSQPPIQQTEQAPLPSSLTSTITEPPPTQLQPTSLQSIPTRQTGVQDPLPSSLTSTITEPPPTQLQPTTLQTTPTRQTGVQAPLPSSLTSTITEPPPAQLQPTSLQKTLERSMRTTSQSPPPQLTRTSPSPRASTTHRNVSPSTLASSSKPESLTTPRTPTTSNNSKPNSRRQTPLFLPSLSSSPSVQGVDSLTQHVGDLSVSEDVDTTVVLDNSVHEVRERLQVKSDRTYQPFYILVPPLPDYVKRFKAKQGRFVQRTRAGGSGLSFGVYEDEDPNYNDSTDNGSAYDESEREAMLLSCSRLSKQACKWNGCEAIMNSTDKLLEHFSREHRPRKQTKGFFQCLWPHCGRSFSDSQKSFFHLRSHAIIPLVCAYRNCKESFRTPRQLAKHHKTEHRKDLIKPSNTLLRPVLDAPPATPQVLPSYMVEARPVQQPSISKDRHNLLGPWVLRNIAGPINLKTKRYNAAKPLRGQTGEGTEGRPGSQPYDFLTFSSTNFSMVSSQPSKLGKMEDLNSPLISDIVNEGLVLWPAPVINEKEDPSSLPHLDPSGVSEAVTNASQIEAVQAATSSTVENHSDEDAVESMLAV